MYKSAVGFKAVLTASISSASTYLMVSPDAVSFMQSKGINGTNYTQIEIYDGVNSEIVDVVNTVSTNALQVTRSSSPKDFPAGSELTFIWTDEGILETADVTASVSLTPNIVGAVTGGPNNFNINFPIYNVDSSLSLSGTYPNFTLSINEAALPDISAVSSVTGTSDFSIVNPTGNVSISLSNIFPTVSGGNFFGNGLGSAGLISGIRVSNTGRLLEVTAHSLPNGSFTNANITVSGGIITSISSGTASEAPSGGITSVNAGTGLVVTGVPTVNPTFSISNTGVTSGLYEGVQINAQGQIVAVPSNFAPISSIVSSTTGVTIASGGTGIKSINISPASDSSPGLIEIADNTEATNSSINTRAITPASLKTAVNNAGKLLKYYSGAGSVVAGPVLTNVVQSVPASEAKTLHITGSVNFNDPLAGGSAYNQSFAVGIYANGICVYSTPTYASGVRSVNTVITDFIGGNIELRCTSPTGSQVASGELHVIGFGEMS